MEDSRPPLTSAGPGPCRRDDRGSELTTVAKRIGDGGRNRREHRNQGDAGRGVRRGGRPGRATRNGPPASRRSRSSRPTTQGRAHRARFVIDGMVKEITYTLVYSYDEPSSMRWVAEPGPDLKELEGSYVFNEVGRRPHRSRVRAQGRALVHDPGVSTPTGREAAGRHRAPRAEEKGRVARPEIEPVSSRRTRWAKWRGGPDADNSGHRQGRRRQDDRRRRHRPGRRRPRIPHAGLLDRSGPLAGRRLDGRSQRRGDRASRPTWSASRSTPRPNSTGIGVRSATRSCRFSTGAA